MPVFYTPKELATRWGCKVEEVRTLIWKGKLRAFRISGNDFRVAGDAIVEYEARREIEAKAQAEAAAKGAEIKAKKIAARVPYDPFPDDMFDHLKPWHPDYVDLGAARVNKVR